MKPKIPAVGSGIAPFGNPDGSRESLDDLMDRFVDFAGNETFGALATRADDMRARVIVGRMGAGKTFYLRRSQASAVGEASVYVDAAQSEPPPTESVVRVCQLFEARDLPEIWRLAWSRAITRTAVAHILRRPALRDRVDSGTRETLSEYRRLIGNRRAPGSVCSHLTEFLFEHDTRQQLTRYLHDGDWSDVNHYLREAIHPLPPMAFFIDGMDEFFAAAPSYWLPCQEGLFHAVMQWLKDPVVGGRLHVVIAIRDLVLSSVLRGEMAGKFRGDPHLRVLDWDATSLTYLLHRKIEKLDDRYLARPDDDGDPIERWLGMSRIDNVARRTSERMLDYLLRHIRLVPRDLVELGNSLCSAVQRANEERQAPPATLIRGTVAAASRNFGTDQIQQCANQISADMAPQRSAEHRYAELYFGADAYLRNHVVDTIRHCLLDIGVDRFGVAALRTAQDEFAKEVDGHSDLPTVLWQNGLLGFTGRRDGVAGTYFYRMGGINDLQPPLTETEYVLHPCLIDAVGVRSVGPTPVSPHR
jgi:hypothetical protein